ncbi:MAG: hypothetical protein N838_01425 [Thiohalocapsa sp. PB-PSB1]|nr:MAG: hypothetical protein N838_01425 [Thiohalocapsa sp. PB-PSB1]
MILGDFCREIDHLACLLFRHRRCRFPKANKNPAPVGLFLSDNRLSRASSMHGEQRK